MVKKEYRLPKEMIKPLYRSRNILRAKGFIIHYKKNELDHARFTIVVSKKVHKHAVKRNRLKRVFREVMKNHLENQYDFLITLNPSVNLELTSRQLTFDMKKLFSQIK